MGKCMFEFILNFSLDYFIEIRWEQRSHLLLISQIDEVFIALPRGEEEKIYPLPDQFWQVFDYTFTHCIVEEYPGPHNVLFKFRESVAMVFCGCKWSDSGNRIIYALKKNCYLKLQNQNCLCLLYRCWKKHRVTKRAQPRWLHYVHPGDGSW